jgi:acyl-coenzyme A synthetase/AMP-(fatty) acid ligase
LLEGDVRRYLKDKLEQHKIPKYIEFTDTIEKTPTAKKIRVKI